LVAGQTFSDEDGEKTM